MPASAVCLEHNQPYLTLRSHAPRIPRGKLHVASRRGNPGQRRKHEKRQGLVSGSRASSTISVVDDRQLANIARYTLNTDRTRRRVVERIVELRDLYTNGNRVQASSVS